MNAGLPKQYLPLAGSTVIEQALRPFLDHPRVAGIVVVLAAEDTQWPRLRSAALPHVLTAVGGAHRADSVLSGLNALAARADGRDWVLVHDAARPCLTRADLDRLIATLETDEVGGLLALPLADTIKRSDVNVQSAETVDRAGLWAAQTPQMFRFGPLRSAVARAVAARAPCTDEAAAIEAVGQLPRLVQGSVRNLKITRQEDLDLAEAILRGSKSGGGAVSSVKAGLGFDVHAFGAGDHVMLGGVRIAHSRGVLAHSDGDVILHALCDALLGAAGLGDIGQHFPDTDPRWRGAASRLFLDHVMGLLKARGLRVANADVTLLAEEPRLGAHRQAIVNALAEGLKVPAASVNVKATTLERLGFIGRGEGIGAQAVVLLQAAD